jgi:DNA-binding NarL/FixJ family response regulator
LFCEGLIRIVSADAAFIVVRPEAARDPLPALHSLNAHIVVLDSRMHRALELCARLRDVGPVVVFVAAPDEDKWCLEALSAGARGILGKGASPDDLVKALRFVSEGQIWTSRPVMTAWIARIPPTSTIADNDVGVGHRLSRRELEVFRYAATGLGNKELAARMAISEATVKVHLTHIFQKLGLRGRAELAAAYHGILPRHTQHTSSSPLDRSA